MDNSVRFHADELIKLVEVVVYLYNDLLQVVPNATMPGGVSMK